MSRKQPVRGRRIFPSLWRAAIEPLEDRNLLTINPSFSGGILSLDASPKDLVIVGSKDGVVTVNGDPIFDGSLKASAVEHLQVSGVFGGAQVTLPSLRSSDFTSLQNSRISLATSDDPELVSLYAEAFLGATWKDDYGWTVDTLRSVLKSGDWQLLAGETAIGASLAAMSLKDAQAAVDQITSAAGLPGLKLDSIPIWSEQTPADAPPLDAASLAECACGCDDDWGEPGGMVMLPRRRKGDILIFSLSAHG